MSYSLNDYLEIKRSNGSTWSPDGKKIAYLNNSTGTFQIYLKYLDNNESIKLTDFEDEVSFASYSPKEDLIAFGKSEKGNENMQIFLLDVKTKNIVPITDNPKAKYVWGKWSLDGKFFSYSSTQRNGKDFDVFIYNLDTSQHELVLDIGGSCGSMGFSPKNNYLIVSRSKGNVENDLFLVDLKNKLHKQINIQDDIAEYGSPCWSLDENGFFLRTNYKKDFAGVSFYNLTEKKFEEVYSPNFDVESLSISYDGKLISLVINKKGYFCLEIFSVQGWKKLYCTEDKMVGGYSWSKVNYSLAIALESSQEPQAIWILSSDFKQLKQFTEHESKVPSSTFVKEDLINYNSFDGLKISSFIYMPKKHNGKLPAIIYLHGGPEGQTQPFFSPLFQYFVANGYAVICPNVRGSTGYGKYFATLDDKRKRLDSVKDMVALSEFLKRDKNIDVNKLSLFGGSYGGFMVLAGLAFYPNLWAAGVCIVGISNFVTFLENTAPYRRSLREYEYGSLNEDREFLISASPYHSADKIKAPLFLIHGANDPRVPLSEARQIAEKIRSHNGKVELLVYNDEGHGLSKLKNRLDAYPKVVDFLNKNFK